MVASGLTKNGNKVELKDAEGSTLTNAVNVGDLKEAANNLVATGFSIADGKGGNDKVKLGETVTFVDPAGNIITTVTDNKVEFGLNSTLSVGKAGEPGKVGIKGADGKDAISLNGEYGTIGLKGADGKDGISLNGKDGTIGINGKDGANATLTVEKAKPALDGKDGQTRIVYTKPNGSKEEVATLNDGLNFKADDGSIVAKKLNETLEIVGGADKDSLTDNNIGVNNKNGKLTVQLAKDLKGIDSITVNNGPVISGNGIDMKGDKITNIKAGTEDNDAVNVSQLKAVEATANKGWNLTTNGKTASKSNVKPGDTVDFANTDGNVKIENTGNNVIVNLNKDIDLTKDGSVTIGDTKVNNDGLTIAGGPSVTKTGINAGDKKITNILATMLSSI
jgi:autotransporter adhesin